MEELKTNQENNTENLEQEEDSHEENLITDEDIKHDHVGEYLEKEAKEERHDESYEELEHSFGGGMKMLLITVVVIVVIVGIIWYII